MEASVHRINQQKCRHKLNSTVIHRLERYIYTYLSIIIFYFFRILIMNILKFISLLFDNNSIEMSLYRERQYCKEFQMNVIMNLNGQRILCVQLMSENSEKRHAKYTTVKSIIVLIYMTFFKMVY